MNCFRILFIYHTVWCKECFQNFSEEWPSAASVRKEGTQDFTQAVKQQGLKLEAAKATIGNQGNDCVNKVTLYTVTAYQVTDFWSTIIYSEPKIVNWKQQPYLRDTGIIGNKKVG